MKYRKHCVSSFAWIAALATVCFCSSAMADLKDVLLAVLNQASATSLTLGNAIQSSETDVWIGTGRSNLSKGIYYCTLNTANGRLSNPTLAAEADGPGFLAMHPQGHVLYTVCTLDGQPVVAAYSIDRSSSPPSLKLINSVEVGDGGGTHLSIDRSGTTILTAQYGGGSLAVFSVNADGSLNRRTQLLKHTGGSRVVPGRQDSSHAHWAGYSPDNRFAFVPDLGLDQVVIYKVDTKTSQVTPHGTAQLPPGSGPRHMKFHPSGKYAFVLNELTLTVTVFRYNEAEGVMTAVETVPTVPEDQKAKEQTVSASEIRVHPGGRFVYSANRGHDSITAFAFDPESGHLTVIETEPVRGATPRNFNLDPSGRWLLAAGQDSSTLASFEVSENTGELTYNRSNVIAPTAICVLFGWE